MGFPSGSVVKVSACQCRRHGTPGFSLWVRETPGEGNDSPLQYSCLENPMGRRAWWATIPGVDWRSDWSRTPVTVENNYLFFSEICLQLLCSQQFMSDSLWPHGLYPARLLCGGVSWARILEWVAMPSSRGSSWSRDQIHFYISCIGRQILYLWVIREASPQYEVRTISHGTHLIVKILVFCICFFD